MLMAKRFISGFVAVVLTASTAFGQSNSDVTPEASGANPELVMKDLGNDKFSLEPPAADSPAIEWERSSQEEIKASLHELMKAVESKRPDFKEPSKFVTAATHTVKAFPAESLYFAIGMGAVAFSQVVFDMAQNPVGLEQHITHSLSPMGMAGFAVFMYFNNLTTSSLMTMVKNPSFMRFLPYLGMTSGFMMQSIFSHVMGDPNILACVKNKKSVTQEDMEKGISPTPCAQAIENFSELRLAPSLVSMLLSTAMAGTLQSGLKKGAQYAGKRLSYRFTGFEIVLAMLPGVYQIKGVRFLLSGVGKVAQITAFVAIDAWLNRIVTYGWKNLFDGKDFYDINNALVDHMNYLKSTDWKERDTESFAPNILPESFEKWMTKKPSMVSRIEYFQKRMSDWRMTNLADVYEAHQNWSSALGQLNLMYNGSYNFYSSIIDRIRTSRYNLSGLKPLEIPYPYTGLKPYDVNASAAEAMLTHPKMYERYQKDMLQMALKFIDPTAWIDGVPAEYLDLIKAVRAGVQGLDDKSQKRLAKIVEKLKSSDDKIVAQGLYALRSEYSAALKDPETRYSKIILFTIEMLGAPSPQMEPGRGYILNYQYAPQSQQFLKDLDFKKGSSIFGTLLASDFFLMQMVCGPNAGEAMIEDNLGYPSRFRPPSIRPATHNFANECISGYAFMDPNSIYTYSIKQEGKKYRGFLSYIVANANQTIIGDKDSGNFTNWWKQNTNVQMKKAFDKYAEKYDAIVASMVRSLYYERKDGALKTVFKFLGINQNGRNTLNQGPVSNATMTSMLQEERMYLAILDEVMQPGRFFEFTLENASVYRVKHPALQNIDMEFGKLAGLMKKIQIVEKDGRERIASSLSHGDVESQIGIFQKSLEEAKTALGIVVDEAEQTGQVTTVKQKNVGSLSETQLQVAGAALKALAKLSEELANYERIADAVSWEKINESGTELKQSKSNEEVSKALKNSGPMTAPGR